MSEPELSSSPDSSLAREIADQFAALPAVEAVALAGSRASQVADSNSDIDLYVYCREPVGLEVRRQIAAQARRAEIGNEFWEPGDEWVDRDTGISVDVMFRDVQWIEERLDAVWRRHRASIGYSTCFWYNVRNSRALFDRAGWFAELQKKASQPYPPELKRAVITKNFPILRRNISSYVHQIELAIAREDLVSVHHRVTASLASYFDILFAVNEQLHPGEKRLIERASALCRMLPGNFPQAVEESLAAVTSGSRMLVRVSKLVDGLEQLLRDEKLMPI
jgi:predicted nucleotidyltransferase